MTNLLDHVLNRKTDDLFNRLNLVDQIQSSIVEANTERGLSIAVFGSWGSGKSTIANWVTSDLNEKKWTKLLIPAWQLESVDEFWATLGYSLYIELEKRNLLKGFESTKAGKTYRQAQEGIKKIIQQHSYTKGDDSYGTIVTAIEAASKISIKRVKGYIKVLNEAGIGLVITVDDMDRMDPKTLPHILLAMQDIFQTEGVNFLVPVDREIAKGAIEEYSEAWKNIGDLFLEKVFDLQFAVSVPTSLEKISMIERLLRPEISIPIIENSSDDLAFLLPDEPRRLKAIATNIAQVKDIIEDHDPFEISSDIIMISSIAKARSLIPFQEFAKHVTISNEEFNEATKVGWLEQLLNMIHGMNESSSDKKWRETQEYEKLTYSLAVDSQSWKSSILIIAGEQLISSKSFRRILEKSKQFQSLSDIKSEITHNSSDFALCINLSPHLIKFMDNSDTNAEHIKHMMILLKLIMTNSDFIGSHRTQPLRVKIFCGIFTLFSNDTVFSVSEINTVRNISKSVRQSWNIIFLDLKRICLESNMPLYRITEKNPGVLKATSEAFFQSLLLLRKKPAAFESVIGELERWFLDELSSDADGVILSSEIVQSLINSVIFADEIDRDAYLELFQELGLMGSDS